MTSGYELHPHISAMVRAQTFSGLKIKDPDLHLQVVPFLPRGEGKTMVHSQREGYDPRLGRASR